MKNSFLLACLSGFLLLSTLLSPASGLAATPKSYPLTCRGGGDYDFRVGPAYRTAGGEGAEVSFRYKPSGGPASAGLKPGECAWMDRGLSNKGQKILVFHFPHVEVLVTLRKNGDQVLEPYFQFNNASLSGEVEALLKKITRGGEFHVHAYYDPNQGALIVTKNGP